MAPLRHFTRSEDITLLRMFIKEVGPKYIGKELRRHYSSITRRLETLQIETREEAAELLERMLNEAPSIVPDGDEGSPVPPVAFTTHDPTDVTAIIFGDPPPGRSALDQRKQKQGA